MVIGSLDYRVIGSLSFFARIKFVPTLSFSFNLYLSKSTTSFSIS